MNRCWAQVLGGCSGKMSREHYVGTRLLKKVRSTGVHPGLEGREVPANALTAHVLCERHNNELSPLDAEAIRLHEGILAWFEHEDDVTTGSGLWSPTSISVNASLFGRWLCKLHCNYRTLGGSEPKRIYVRHAFGVELSNAVRFYTRLQVGDQVRYQRRIWYADYFVGWNEPEEYSVFHVYFMGLHFLVCPFQLTEPIRESLAKVAQSDFYLGDWTENPAQLIWNQGNIATKFLHLDWNCNEGV